MSIIGYARCESSSDASKARHDMRAWCFAQEVKVEIKSFDFDFLSGERGLTHTLRSLESGDTLLIRHLSNLGRSLHELLKNANELLTKRGVGIMVVSTGLEFRPGAEQPDTRVFAALLTAHSHYVQENVKRGMEAAKAGGAIIGRPPRAEFTIERVRETIGELLDANAGVLPSSRTLAKEVGCSKSKAAQLLQQYAKEAKT